VSETAFYCVADARYFPGAVALINSLRLVGHAEPVRLLDLGLTPDQRELIGSQATLVEGDPATPPWLAKTVAPLADPAPVTVMIDADMIVTRPLTELVEAARDGVVVFRNDTDRWVDRWGELLDLGPMRRRPYVSSGLVLAGGATGAETLRLLDDRQRRVDIGRTFAGSDDDGYPFRYPEQDVLNAILATRIAEERIRTLDNALAPNPPYRGVRIADEATLRCTGPAGEPFVLHQFVRKPWLEPTYHGVYARLMSRLLLADDVAIRVPPETLPRRMRRGPLASAERLGTNAFDLARWYLVERPAAWWGNR